MKLPDLTQPAWQVAPKLLGAYLVRELDGQQLVGKIVETEAYDQQDAASHSYKGRTPRTDIMFGAAGYLYVYFTYGMHYCCNVVTGKAGEGSAVLIRALEPLEGIEIMKQNRRGRTELTNGPAKLCHALKIDHKLNGHSLASSPFRLSAGQKIRPEQIIKTTRIGITRDTHRPWRFYIKDNSFVSKL